MDLANLLASDDDALQRRWDALVERLGERFGQKPGLEGVLFLIGIQSRGRGYEPKLKKERKQALIMEGTWCAFESIGLYQRVGADENGAWIWQPQADLPHLDVEEQEKLLRTAVLSYFDANDAPV